MLMKQMVVRTLGLGVCCSLLACGRVTPGTPPPSGNEEGTMEHPTAAVVAMTPNVENPAITLNPTAGEEIGYVYEAYLSPHQEPGEEKDTPALIPDQFKSTTPSLLRAERTSRGHGVLRFTKDLSKVYVDVAVAGFNLEEVNMFHIHCGRPDMLGPIVVDFAVVTNIQENIADGQFSVEVTNAHIEQTLAEAEGAVGAFTLGCPITPGLPDKAKTIAGMEYIAQQGELYFNLHTTGQTYFGNMRGQIHPVP